MVFLLVSSSGLDSNCEPGAFLFLSSSRDAGRQQTNHQKSRKQTSPPIPVVSTAKKEKGKRNKIDWNFSIFKELLSSLPFKWCTRSAPKQVLCMHESNTRLPLSPSIGIRNTRNEFNLMVFFLAHERTEIFPLNWQSFSICRLCDYFSVSDSPNRNGENGNFYFYWNCLVPCFANEIDFDFVVAFRFPHLRIIFLSAATIGVKWQGTWTRTTIIIITLKVEEFDKSAHRHNVNAVAVAGKCG